MSTSSNDGRERSFERASEMFLANVKELSEHRRISMHDAFVVWIVENILNIEEESKIDEIVDVGGKGDSGIDFFYLPEDYSRDDPSTTICWGQAKFSDDLDYVCTREMMLDFISTIDRLEAPFERSNNRFKEISSNYNHCKDQMKKKMFFIITGTLNSDASELINSSEYASIHKDKDVEWEIYDLKRILGHIIEPITQPLSLKFDGNVCNGPNGTILGYVQGNEIIRICKEHMDEVFLANPRESLGRTPTNKIIANTLEKNKNLFWKLNNGITAVCDEITDEGNNTFSLTNFKIVNGLQTSKTLVKHKELVDKSVLLSVTIHRSSTYEERDLISNATNTQNPIKFVDTITNKPLLQQLGLDFEQNHINWHFEKQQKSYQKLSQTRKNSITLKRKLEKGSMVRRYMAFTKKPHDSINIGERELFNDENIESIFQNTGAMDFIIPHIFALAIKEYKKQCKEVHNSNADHPKAIQYTYLKFEIIQRYTLSVISLSLNKLSEDEKEKQIKIIYEHWNVLQRKDAIPEELIKIVKTACSRLISSILICLKDKSVDKIKKELRDFKNYESISTHVEFQEDTLDNDIQNQILNLK